MHKLQKIMAGLSAFIVGAFASAQETGTNPAIDAMGDIVDQATAVVQAAFPYVATLVGLMFSLYLIPKVAGFIKRALGRG